MRAQRDEANTSPRHLRTLRQLGASAILAVAMAACGGEESTGDPAVSDADAQVAGTDKEAADAADPVAEDGAGQDAAPPGVERIIDTTLVAEDGWNDPLDLDIPAAGTAVMEIDGHRLEFDVQCLGTGVVTDDQMDGNLQLNQFIPFNFALRGTGQSEEFGTVSVTASRAIVVAGDRAIQIRNSGWGGEGQLDIVSLGGIGEVSSRQQSPSSVDPDGDRLPFVRVSESGVVTAQGEMTREFESDTDSYQGPYTLAARCQETWPDDQR